MDVVPDWTQKHPSARFTLWHQKHFTQPEASWLISPLGLSRSIKARRWEVTTAACSPQTPATFSSSPLGKSLLLLLKGPWRILPQLNVIIELIPVRSWMHYENCWIFTTIFFNINFTNIYKHFTNTEISKSLHSLWTPVEANCSLSFCISDVTQLLGSAFQIVLLLCYHGSHNILQWQTTFLPQDRHPHPTPSKDNGNYFPEN